MENHRFLEGRVALVTGDRGESDAQLPWRLADAGADVAINYQHCVEAADEVCGKVRELGRKAGAFRADVSSSEQCDAMVDLVAKDFGRVDILVNNAGITRDKSFLKMSRQMWDEVLGVNLTGTFNITHSFLNGMVENGWGRVINIASVVGQMGNFGQSNYAVTKGGLIAFTMSLAAK